ncbi:hypothetical protein [Haloferax larsenii]|uniref:Uncharacterized protein n=1 Tax=Haloferax larsenii TaxID=302484 RepID=A0A1H7MTU4_HALLR|nr:hypothetical protein [Haloferax larsenii]SEL14017.1 hypothetical protein SAMN04488691_10372 [Haloferax larsenii]
MEANIELETGEGVAIRVIDNQQKEHKIEMYPDGEIDYHSTNGYASDPSDRTNSEDEFFSQARRYAQYHVAQETDHDTIPWDLNPDQFETVRRVLLNLSAEEVETWFGELFAQSLSHYRDHPDVDTGDVSRPHELPADKIGPESAVLYKQEIYLDDADEIEAVSGVIVEYYVAKGERRTVHHGEVPDRDPDACVEVSPAPLVAVEPFRDYLAYNLRCQIRDCYVGMGLEPPSQYKVLGPGQYRFTGKYQHFECYPEYYRKDADIPGYSHEFTPELPVSESELGGLLEATGNQSLYDQLKDTLFSA